MDYKIRILLADATNQKPGSLWLYYTPKSAGMGWVFLGIPTDPCHILQGKRMGTNVDDLVDEVHVVLEVVLLFGILCKT